MDGSGWDMVVAQAETVIPSAAATARSTWRADTDRRRGAPWFEDQGDPCTLLVFIDDATGRIVRCGEYRCIRRPTECAAGWPRKG